MNHLGVVKVLGFGLLPDDRPYLAMERLTGESLADRFRRGPMVLQGMATPDVTTGSGRIDSKISAEVRFAYADAAQAEAVRATLQGQLDAANRDGMVKILLGETKVDRVENEVVLMVKPNPESTELIAQGVAAAFGTVLGDR